MSRSIGTRRFGARRQLESDQPLPWPRSGIPSVLRRNPRIAAMSVLLDRLDGDEVVAGQVGELLGLADDAPPLLGEPQAGVADGGVGAEAVGGGDAGGAGGGLADDERAGGEPGGGQDDVGEVLG